MDFATIEPALRTLAAALTGIAAGFCVFENAAPYPRHNGQLVELSWVSTSPRGVEETSWEYAAGPDPLAEMTPTVEGHRVAVLQLSIESHDQRPGYTARHLAERARTRLRFPSSLAALSAVGLALASVGDVRVADYEVDDRSVSRCIVEVTLNAVASETDTAGATSYIDTVDVTGEVSGPDGVALPDSIQPTTNG